MKGIKDGKEEGMKISIRQGGRSYEGKRECTIKKESNDVREGKGWNLRTKHIYLSNRLIISIDLFAYLHYTAIFSTLMKYLLYIIDSILKIKMDR